MTKLEVAAVARAERARSFKADILKYYDKLINNVL